MSVTSVHPFYSARLPDWEQLRDTFAGERRIKEAGFKYLPATASMIEDGALTGNTTSEGFKAYDAYRLRARYPGFIRAAVEGLVGVMHMKPPTIELTPSLEPLMENATFRNESLPMLLRRINEEQLKMGRVGLLGDVIDSGERAGQTYISTYLAETIINWDEGQKSRDIEGGTGSEETETTEPQNLNLVVLDETGPERVDDFEWQTQTKYRVLVLGDPEADEPKGEGIYRFVVVRGEDSFLTTELAAPKVKGKTLNEIPFVFINGRDVVSEPDDPPLLELSNLTLTIYRGEADYRQSLFMQGQDTFVTIGGENDKRYRLGAGYSVNIPTVQGDAKFVGVNSEGLVEQREALVNDYARAERESGQMLNQLQGGAESGEALRVRVGTRTSSLMQVALTGAFGLQSLLRSLARWNGEDPEKVIVTPNTDFVSDELLGRTLVEYMTAKSMGAPLALETIHTTMRKKDLTDKTFEEEIAQIKAEEALDLQGIGSSNPNGPEDDPDDPNPDDPNPDDPNPGNQGGAGGSAGSGS